jgi:hypothetical protein
MECWTALDTIWLPNVVLAASPNRTSSGHRRSRRDGPTLDDGLSRLIYVSYDPNQSMIGR